MLLVAAQVLAFMISESFLQAGLPGGVCNIIAGILYVVFVLTGASVLCRRLFRLSMEKMRIPAFGVKALWLASAVLMPVLVLLFSIIAGGHWEVHTFDKDTTMSILTGAVIFYGLAAGIAEEVIFRGLIMGCLEKRFGLKIAVIIPSVIFGALHIIGASLDFASTLQLLTAGSIVGILFSLITYTTNSVWNSALVHGIWNMAIVGGILHIGTVPDNSVIFNFVLKNKDFFISGGDFGIEASVISVFAYLLFSILAVLSVKMGKKTK